MYNHQFFSSMAKLGPFEDDPTIAVAVSGGGDSMALLLLAHAWSQQVGGNIVALTVDHGLRKEAKEEAQQIQQWLKRYSIEHHILTYNGPLPTANIQEQARNIRYALMSEWCQQHNVLHLLVGHTLDDQAETLLIRLQRGSGIDGLCAMMPANSMYGIHILRPLLEMTRQELREFLHYSNQEWIDDPSNNNNEYTRNALRKALSTNIDDHLLAKRLADTTNTMARARSALESQVNEFTAKYVTLYPEGWAILNRKALKDAPEEIGLRVLANLLTCVSGNDTSPRFEKVQRLYYALSNEQAFKGCTLCGCSIMPSDDNVICYRELAAIAHTNALLSPHSTILWDKRFLTSISEDSPLTNCKVKNLCKNSLAEIAPNKTENKLFFKKRHLPKNILYTLPIIVEEQDGLETLVAAPHIGYYNNVSASAFTCSFLPSFSLTNKRFGYCAQ